VAEHRVAAAAADVPATEEAPLVRRPVRAPPAHAPVGHMAAPEPGATRSSRVRAGVDRSSRCQGPESGSCTGAAATITLPSSPAADRKRVVPQAGSVHSRAPVSVVYSASPNARRGGRGSTVRCSGTGPPEARLLRLRSTARASPVAYWTRSVTLAIGSLATPGGSPVVCSDRRGG
jgi:hypothetical protein